jgi:putative hydrolase of the HAD superfamily
LSISAVLLDWGHTLFDTPGSVEFIADFASQQGHAISRDEIYTLWNDARVRSRSADEIAKGRDKSASLHRQCWSSLWAQLEQRCPGVSEVLYEFETSAAGWSPYVDTAAVLTNLSERHIPVVIISDVAFDLRPILRHYNLDHLVHTYVLSGEHGTIKPELHLFRVALDAVGVAAEHALMVGDNHINDGAAIDAGIRTVLLPPVAHGSPRGLSVILDLIDAGV